MHKLILNTILNDNFDTLVTNFSESLGFRVLPTMFRVKLEGSGYSAELAGPGVGGRRMLQETAL